MFELRVTGVEETQADLDRIARGMVPTIEGAVEEGLTVVQRDARIYSPFLTGALRASIEPEVVTRDTVVEGVVGSGLPYAGVQERRVKFLYRALVENTKRIVGLVEDAIARLVGS